MHAAVVLVGPLLCATLMSCAHEPTTTPDAGPGSGSPEVIKQLARQTLSLGGFDACRAIRDAGAEDGIAALVGTDSLNLQNSFVDNEDAARLSCTVSTDTSTVDNPALSIEFFQGSEFKGAGPEDPVVFPGCRVLDKPPPVRDRSAAGIRTTCAPDLTIDVSLSRVVAPAVLPWTSDVDSRPAPEYVDLVHDLLVALSSQG